MPLYLGAFLKNEEVGTKMIKKYVSKALNEICDEFPKHEPAVNCFEDNFMKWVKDFHVTSCYIGRNKKKLESEFCTTFS